MDQEESPLLEDNEDGRQVDSNLNRLVKEPLTPLTRSLFVLVLVLLLLTSVLLGFSIGLEQKLAKASESNDTITSTWTTTITALPTSPSIPPPKPTEPPDDNDSVCLRPECVLLAASIIDGLDMTKDPCEEFYEFSNGKWLQDNPLPHAKDRFGTFNQVQGNNNRLLERILTEKKEMPSPDSETLGKLQKFYRSCLDEPRLNTLGHQPLIDFVNTVKRVFNSSSTDVASAVGQRVFKDNSRQGLTAALAYIHSRGINALFEFSFDGDAAVEPNTMTLWFSQPRLGLEAKEYYQDTGILRVYTSTLTRILEAFERQGAQVSQSDSDKSQRRFWPPFPWPPWGDDDDETPTKKTPRELAESVVEFEGRIAEASLDLVSLQLDPIRTYNPVSHEEFADLIPQIDFLAYWSSFAPRSYPSKIIVTYKDYLTFLSNLLSNTSSDVIEAYLIARTSLTLAEYLGPETEIWKAHRSLIESLTGISEGAVQRRGEYCMEQVTDINALGFASGRFFVLEAFDQDSQTDVRNIMFNIIHSFKESVLNLSWMDETSSKAAAEKASSIHINIGYPSTPNTTNPTSIANYYSRLTVAENNFFDNILTSRTFATTNNWQLLGKQRDFGRFQYLSPSVVNAYLDPLANMIVLPAGIIQYPFYHSDWPGYMKYGALGAVASHELTHAFDSAGRFYDQNAILREWWSNETSEAFEERRACLSQQYSSYTVDDGDGGVIHLNGNLTSGEDIGDSGFVQAYRGWKAQYAESYENGREYLLPGLDNFTREQLFFIAFAKIWAENLTPQAALKNILTNPHSLNRYRVLGTLVNIPEFAEAFKCPVGSKYNPPDKTRCKFW